MKAVRRIALIVGEKRYDLKPGEELPEGVAESDIEYLVSVGAVDASEETIKAEKKAKAEAEAKAKKEAEAKAAAEKKAQDEAAKKVAPPAEEPPAEEPPAEVPPAEVPPAEAPKQEVKPKPTRARKITSTKPKTQKRN